MLYFLKNPILMKENTHIGVYGIVEHEGSILMIRKERGTYKGHYDLPGGGIKFREHIKDALKREFLEEVGAPIRTMKLYQVADKTSIWDNHADDIETFHIGIYYLVTLEDLADIKLSQVEGDHGCVWIPKSELHSSPIASILQEVFELS